MNPALLIASAAFLVMCLLFFAIFALQRYRAQRRALLAKIQETDRAFDPTAASLSTPADQGFLERKFVPFLASLGKRIRSTDAQEATHVRQQLLKAGYRRPNAVPVYYGTRIFMAILLPTIMLVINGTAYRFLPPRMDMPAAVLLALIGYILPSVLLDLKKAHRKRKIFEGLPDALDLMVVCVEAGMGLDSAINRVSEEIGLDNKVVSDEFRLVGLELRAGKARADALRNLAIRSDLEDINSLVSLLIQADKFGTSIVQSLKVHSDSMRTKRFQMAEELAAKLPVKMVFPLILFIFPALFVVIVGPAIISIYRNILERIG